MGTPIAKRARTTKVQLLPGREQLAKMLSGKRPRFAGVNDLARYLGEKSSGTVSRHLHGRKPTHDWRRKYSSELGISIAVPW